MRILSYCNKLEFYALRHCDCACGHRPASSSSSPNFRFVAPPHLYRTSGRHPSDTTRPLFIISSSVAACVRIVMKFSCQRGRTPWSTLSAFETHLDKGINRYRNIFYIFITLSAVLQIFCIRSMKRLVEPPSHETVKR